MNTALAIEVAEALARRFEQFRSRPYLCPAAIPTIGYGATYYENGVRVTLFDPAISQTRAEELLHWMVQTKYLPVVVMLCPTIDSPERLAAFVDFTFNLGGDALRHSTLRRRANAGTWGAVPAELRKWVHAGGRRLNGLILRREAEAVLV